MAIERSFSKVGVFVDVANIAMNGGFGMLYDVLRDFAARDGAEVVRLNAYVAFDAERAESDLLYRNRQCGFFSALRDQGFKVIEKKVKWYVDENGNRFGKANADLDLAVDALLQSDSMDRILLATGDGDFVQVVRALQNKGCRVETLAFDHVSADLKREADMFVSGYLVPNLLPTDSNRSGPAWGEIGSRVRGICSHHDRDKGFGFLRFLKTISPSLLKKDTRDPESPYEAAFFHDTNLPSTSNPGELPNRNVVFEFDIQKSENRETGIQASKISIVNPRTRKAPRFDSPRMKGDAGTPGSFLGQATLQ